ncbi:NusA family KH domain protein, archaeal [Pyrodictium delaneyi]|uniref:Probable transcription termination protein NusA n=1 Tax=Pyrodictium delaneyi TaxID=1273541 RepID=A0A0N7JCW0_9CREN|nr:NusA-like transcription termination signal-binding factor [Pyrodictium delaneyi]ALL00489.1 NusA family KH domain protein, archaeal [Pyrodictium delaneyi]OWJ53960.1 transcription elongation factor NusA [Pyrodictium delaneyi]
MVNIRLTAEEMRYMALLQDLTGAIARDCIVDSENNRVIFLVRPGDAGKAIGRRGANINRLRRLLGKEIEVVEFADDLESLVKNLFAPARILSVRVAQRNGRKILYVTVDPSDKGRAIGKGGRKVSVARIVLKRYYDIDEIKIR